MAFARRLRNWAALSLALMPPLGPSLTGATLRASRTIRKAIPPSRAAAATPAKTSVPVPLEVEEEVAEDAELLELVSDALLSSCCWGVPPSSPRGLASSVAPAHDGDAMLATTSTLRSHGKIEDGRSDLMIAEDSA